MMYSVWNTAVASTRFRPVSYTHLDVYKRQVVVRRVLVARVVRDARLRLTVVEDAGELLCDCLVGIGIQVPICPKRGLYLLMPEPFLEEQWAFSHVDEK